MSYKVLARQWRPKTFAEVIGQEYTVRALTNALKTQRLHHAYLFTGTRGIGKKLLLGAGELYEPRCRHCFEPFLDEEEVASQSGT